MTWRSKIDTTKTVEKLHTHTQKIRAQHLYIVNASERQTKEKGEGTLRKKKHEEKRNEKKGKKRRNLNKIE